MAFSVLRRISAVGVATNFLNEVTRTLRHPMTLDVGLLTVAQYVAAGLGFLEAVVVARLLGPSEYGIAALVTAYPTLLWSFVGTKSVSVTTRYIMGFRASGRDDELKSLCKLGYGLDLFVSVFAFILVSTTSCWVARFVYDMPHLSWLMITYAASFPFVSLAGTSSAILSSWQRFLWLAVFQVLAQGIPFIIVISFLLAGFGVTGMIVGTALGHAAIGFAMVCTATYTLYRDGRGLWWETSLGSVAPLREELTAFLGWNYLVVTLSGVIGQVPLMLLGRLRGPEEAGFYRLATSLTAVGSYLESSLGRVTHPVLCARWSAGKGESFNRMLRRWTLRGGLPVGALVLLAIPLLPIVVPLMFGPGYSAMVLGAQVMMSGGVVSAMFFWINSFYYAQGKFGPWTKAYSLYTAMVIGLAWFCIARWGFIGLAGLVTVGKVMFTASMAAICFITSER